MLSTSAFEHLVYIFRGFEFDTDFPPPSPRKGRLQVQVAILYAYLGVSVPVLSRISD